MEKQSHTCLICANNTNYYFSKEYPSIPDSPFTEVLKVDYWKCDNCGFVISKTHQEMSPEKWSELNEVWHHLFESDANKEIINQPPYADQALALTVLGKNGLIEINDVLDYAAGYGTLSKFLAKYLNAKIKIYDRYVRDSESELEYVEEEDLKKYKLVINSAMFEHVLSRAALDEINDLVEDDGVLMLHTVICERIPKDPNWFYLTPMVHTAFHTNKSMKILMEQWGYAASIYSPQAKSWFLFKKNFPEIENLETKVNEINKEIQTEYFHYKAGFVDYWKGF